MYAFASPTVNSPRWKIEAASTASADPSRAPSTRWSSVPTPPDATTGTGVRSAIVRVSSRSNPSRVPSRSIEVINNSPAPTAAHCSDQATASRPVGVRPPWVNTSHSVASPDAPFRSAAAGVDCHDHALATELVGQLGDESRPVHRCGVDTDLVRTGPEQLPGILDRAHPSADGEGDEDHLGGPRDDVDHRPSVVRGSSDVEEDQFIGTLGVIARRQLDRVAGVEQVDEPDALDHPTCVHVQAGDHTDRPQASTPSATVILPSTRALPAITPPSRRSPRPPAVSGASTRTTRPASDSTSATDPTPPEAITGSAVRCKTARSPSRSGPESMPSRSMAVTITAANSTAPNSPRTSETVRPLPSSQPRTATSARPSVPWR